MKHQITKESDEELELNVEDDKFALVQRVKGPDGMKVKVVIMNKREALRLYQAISDEILKL